MCRLLETIKVVNRKFVNLHLHQARVNRTLAELGFGVDLIDLSKTLSIPEYLTGDVYKCRIVYGKIIQKVEFIPYRPAPVKTLKLVHEDQIDYHLKFANRDTINKLMELRGVCDDILIVKNGFITDSSYCNILFFDGKDWITPKSPLLQGTKRQQLLDEGRIIPEEIMVDDVQQFESFMLINAMLDFDERRRLPVANILE